MTRAHSRTAFRTKLHTAFHNTFGTTIGTDARPHVRPVIRTALGAAIAAAMLASCAQIGPGPAATAAAKTTQSTPVLAGGYKKVAAPAGASLYFIDLKNGAVVASPVRVHFGLRGMGVAPAGMERENTGHHHLLINVDNIDVNAPLPTNDSHRHFGGGQTESSVELKPGTYTLQLILGDQNHIPHHPPVLSERISITVK